MRSSPTSSSETFPVKMSVIILIFSCQKQQVSPVITIKVPEIANDVWMTMSEIVDTAIYIPLETTDECLIDASMFRRMENFIVLYLQEGCIFLTGMVDSKN